MSSRRPLLGARGRVAAPPRGGPPVAIAWLLITNQFAADLWRLAMDGRYVSTYPLHYSVFEIKESVISILLAVGAYFWYRGVRRASA